MDANPIEKKVKSPGRQSPYAQIRVKKETRKKVLHDLARVNKKDFGRSIRADEYIALAISRITPSDITALQESSLSNADRLAKDYREYVAKHGPITRDEYLGQRLTGEISNSSTEVTSKVEGGSDGTSNH